MRVGELEVLLKWHCVHDWKEGSKENKQNKWQAIVISGAAAPEVDEWMEEDEIRLQSLK